MTHQITNPDTTHPDCSDTDCSFTLGVLHEYIADGETYTPAGLNLENGGEITFGYIRSNSNTTPDSTQTNVHGIDNFRVVIVKQ